MSRGSAATDGRFAYFTPFGSNSVYRYEYSTEKWEEVLSCPYQDSGLVIIDGKLTAVGGQSQSRGTNKLYTLQQLTWIEKYPPMNTARSRPAAVSTSDGEYVIVVGGYGYIGGGTKVELLKVKRRTWFKLKNLPQPLSDPSPTICGGTLHMVGNHRGYSCSIQSLPSSDKPILPQSIPHLLSWISLPPLPVTGSTAATLHGQLVLVGGRRDGSQVNSIHQLVDGQWVKIGSMVSHMDTCLVGSQSPEKITVVGGYGAFNRQQDSVEECFVV